MAGTVGPIPDTITKAGNSTKKFIAKLQETNLEIIYGKKIFSQEEIAELDPNDPKSRKKIL